MLKILVKKQLMEIFRSWFYNSKKNKKRSAILLAALSLVLVFVLCAPAFASDSQPSDQASEPAVLSAPTEATEDKTVSTKAVAAAAVVGIVATAGAAAMAISIAKSTSGMARQPEAAGKINSAMMLGLVFIETGIIYALIIAILIIFVL